MISLGRGLIILGMILLVVGALLIFSARLNLPIGRLPGDIRIERDNLTCIIPLASSILLSILLSIILNLLVRFLDK